MTKNFYLQVGILSAALITYPFLSTLSAEQLPIPVVAEPTLLKKAEYIFIGTVKQIEPFPYECGRTIGWQRVHYEVHQLLKGQLQGNKEDLIVSYFCGVPDQVRVGQERLVFGWMREYGQMPSFLENLKTVEATSDNIQQLKTAVSLQLQ